jgi:hypothetical protein
MIREYDIKAPAGILRLPAAFFFAAKPLEVA